MCRKSSLPRTYLLLFHKLHILKFQNTLELQILKEMHLYYRDTTPQPIHDWLFEMRKFIIITEDSGQTLGSMSKKKNRKFYSCLSPSTFDPRLNAELQNMFDTKVCFGKYQNYSKLTLKRHMVRYRICSHPRYSVRLHTCNDLACEDPSNWY